jgi:hypothetical protein
MDIACEVDFPKIKCWWCIQIAWNKILEANSWGDDQHQPKNNVPILQQSNVAIENPRTKWMFYWENYLETGEFPAHHVWLPEGTKPIYLSMSFGTMIPKSVCHDRGVNGNRAPKKNIRFMIFPSAKTWLGLGPCRHFAQDRKASPNTVESCTGS